MSETRSFKNVYYVDNSSTEREWYVFPVRMEPHAGAFPFDEWDMEVTFTKKRREIKPLMWAETGKRGEEVSVYVLAIHGKMAWVSEDPDGLAGGALTAWTEDLDQLR